MENIEVTKKQKNINEELLEEQLIEENLNINADMDNYKAMKKCTQILHLATK